MEPQGGKQSARLSARGSTWENFWPSDYQDILPENMLGMGNGHDDEYRSDAASFDEEQVNQEVDKQKSNKANQLASSGRLTSIQTTISDDRSQGSEFHRNSHILYALERTTANEKSGGERSIDSSSGKQKYVNV
ncbi:hypothetical protein V8C40DRAFT_245624 [Trichoderma camerunense]